VALPADPLSIASAHLMRERFFEERKTGWRRAMLGAQEVIYRCQSSAFAGQVISMMPQISQSAAMRRDDICICVSAANRARLEAIIADRNSKAKMVSRAKIVLETADGHGTN
jgi:hypothetical protein